MSADASYLDHPIAPDAPEPTSAGLDAPWAEPAQRVAEALQVDPDRGLSDAEVVERRARYGENVLQAQKGRSAWRILADQFANVVVLLLVVAGVVAAVFGEWIEAAAIGVVVVINTVIGFWMELSAVRSMEALQKVGRAQVRVRRGGGEAVVSADELVPGDVVVIEAGDVVSADLRIVEAAELGADESVLTGESVPVDKRAEAVAASAPLAERLSMLHRGSAVTRGSALGVVVATGMATEVGRIAEMVAGVESPTTPLEERLDALGRKLVVVCVGIAVVIGLVNAWLGRDLVELVETSIALAVATIPEGLPIVATIALARGMWRMARQQALVKNLSAVETLGSTSVICTDKTGTLTYNHLSVAELATAQGISTAEEAAALAGPAETAIEISALCNSATLGVGGQAPAGDPLEVALLEWAEEARCPRETLLGEQPQVGVDPFDTETKMMVTVHRAGPGRFRHAVKGAPEVVIERSVAERGIDGDDQPLDLVGRRRWLETNRQLAARGLRVLAVAEKYSGDDAPSTAELVLVGLVALVDPAREDAAQAVAECHGAGLRVIMITGDQPLTARYIAQKVGIVADADAPVADAASLTADAEAAARSDIFARVEPAHKLDIIRLHQDRGHVVAMTGDGVNDAPALRAADIGVAMGKRGTQVACEASDVVLRDDRFATITVAIRQGRIIFQNIRMFVRYLLSCNVSELLTIFVASVAFPGLPLPITALQILFLNLVTDVFPALALGLGEGDKDIMRRPPRALGEAIIARRHWAEIAGWGVVLMAITLTTYLLAHDWLSLAGDAAITVAFMTLAIGQLTHVFNMRTPSMPLVRNALTTNPYIWGAIAVCLVVLAVPFGFEVSRDALSLTPLSPDAWALVAAGGVAPAVLGAVWHIVRRLFR